MRKKLKRQINITNTKLGIQFNRSLGLITNLYIKRVNISSKHQVEETINVKKVCISKLGRTIQLIERLIKYWATILFKAETLRHNRNSLGALNFKYVMHSC